MLSTNAGKVKYIRYVKLGNEIVKYVEQDTNREEILTEIYDMYLKYTVGKLAEGSYECAERLYYSSVSRVCEHYGIEIDEEYRIK